MVVKKRGACLESHKKKEFIEIQRKVESLKGELHDVAYEHKRFVDVTSDAARKYYAGKHIENLLGSDLRTIFPMNAFVITLTVILLLGGVLYIAFSNPEITGAAITETAKVVGHKAVATSAGMFIVILILGLVFHRVDYHHKHKHDKYKHPKMLK